jgi:hypothetical protein
MAKDNKVKEDETGRGNENQTISGHAKHDVGTGKNTDTGKDKNVGARLAKNGVFAKKTTETEVNKHANVITNEGTNGSTNQDLEKDAAGNFDEDTNMYMGEDDDQNSDKNSDENETETEMELFGASRITGGKFRGRAKGNVANMADLGKFSFFLGTFFIDIQIADAEIECGGVMSPVDKGFIFLYCNQADKEPFAFEYDIRATLHDALEELSGLYSPVKSKWLISVRQLTNFSSEKNPHIFVREGSVWMMKGRFEKAICRQEPLPWKHENGKVLLALLAVCHVVIS